MGTWGVPVSIVLLPQSTRCVVSGQAMSEGRPVTEETQSMVAWAPGRVQDEGHADLTQDRV